jgi:hypothetical protein
MSTAVGTPASRNDGDGAAADCQAGFRLNTIQTGGDVQRTALDVDRAFFSILIVAGLKAIATGGDGNIPICN